MRTYRQSIIKHCWGNFKGGKPQQICQLCCEPSTTDTQEHLFNCNVINENMQIEESYTDIFEENISEKIAKTLQKIISLREEILIEKQEKSH